MRNTGKYIITALLLILAQGALDNYINLSVYLDIQLCLFIILMLPYGMGTIPAMLTAFVVGLVSDFLGNSIPGMSAAAFTAAALCRRSMLMLTAGKETTAKDSRQSISSIGTRRFFLYSLPLLIISLTVYILIDSSGFSPLGLCITRLAVSTAVNAAIMFLLYLITADRR